MVWSDRIAPFFQAERQFVHPFARGAVDDAGLVFKFFKEAGELVEAVVFGFDFEEEVVPVETGDKFVRGLEIESFFDILLNPRCGRGRECHAYGVGEFLSYLHDLPVLGPEVVSPFGDAVGFVDSDAVHADIGEQFDDPGFEEGFGGDIQQLEFVSADFIDIMNIVFAGEGTVEEVCGDAEFFELFHLVFHQRDEW